MIERTIKFKIIRPGTDHERRLTLLLWYNRQSLNLRSREAHEHASKLIISRSKEREKERERDLSIRWRITSNEEKRKKEKKNLDLTSKLGNTRPIFSETTSSCQQQTQSTRAGLAREKTRKHEEHGLSLKLNPAVGIRWARQNEASANCVSLRASGVAPCPWHRFVETNSKC